MAKLGFMQRDFGSYDVHMIITKNIWILWKGLKCDKFPYDKDHQAHGHGASVGEKL